MRYWTLLTEKIFKNEDSFFRENVWVMIAKHKDTRQILIKIKKIEPKKIKFNHDYEIKLEIILVF